jgi:hypothetical protein
MGMLNESAYKIIAEYIFSAFVNFLGITGLLINAAQTIIDKNVAAIK